VGGDVTPSDPPAPPTIDERLNWDAEAQGDMPEELSSVPLADLAAYRESVTEEATKAAEERIAAEVRRAEEARQARDRDLAGQKELAQYAEALDRRIEGDDDDDRKLAIEERASNRDRYERGIAASVDVRTTEQDRNAIERHYAPLTAGLIAAGHQRLLDNYADLLAKNSNNPLLAALEYGRALGKDGAPAMRPGDGGSKKQFSEIDLKRSGGGKALFRAASATGSKR
jgi:hypothetical protein